MMSVERMMQGYELTEQGADTLAAMLDDGECWSKLPDTDVACILGAGHPGFHLSATGGEAWSDPYRHAGEARS